MRSHITQASVWHYVGSTRLYWQCRGNKNILSHIFVQEKLYFDIMYFRILCVCLRKFLVNCSGSFCFIVLQNQSPPFLLTIPGRRKIFKATHLFESSPNFSGTYSRILCICLRKFLLYQESNYSVIYWQFLEGKKNHSGPSSRIIFKFLQNIIWSIVRLSAKISFPVVLFFLLYQEINYSVIYWQFLEGENSHSDEKFYIILTYKIFLTRLNRN